MVIENWQLILAFLAPIAISVISQFHWSTTLKSISAFVFCAVTTVVGLYLKGGVDWNNVPSTVIFVFALTIGSYYGFWKPTGIAPHVEKATTFL
jgi:hypothetical protein